MAPRTRKRPIEYCRAVWGDKQEPTLEVLLRRAFGEIQDLADTAIEYGDGSCEVILHAISRGEKESSRLLIHAVKFRSREQMTVVPDLEKIEGGTFQMDTRPAPQGQEYLDAETMILVSDNHCLVMNYYFRLGGVRRILSHTLKETGLLVGGHWFALKRVANPGTLPLLDQPVQSVSFDLVSSYTAAESQRRDHRRQSVARRIGDRVLSIVMADGDKEEWLDKSNMQVSLVVACNGRFKEGRLGVEPITNLGRQLVQNDEESDYEVRLKDGTLLTDESIRIRKEVVLPALGKTVPHEAAWDAMDRYWRELKDDGVLDW